MWKLALVTLLCVQCALSQVTSSEVEPKSSEHTGNNTTDLPPLPEGSDKRPKTTTTPTTTTTTTSTTEKPTTTVPPTPTPVPTPTPAPPKFPTNVGTWNVTETENVTFICILFHGALELEITRPVDNKTTETILVPIPREAEASGSCGYTNGTNQALVLGWTIPGEKEPSALSFYFVLNKTALTESAGPIPPNHYALKEVAGSIQLNATHNLTKEFVFENIYAYPTEESNSYHCLARESLTTSKSPTVVLKLEQLQLQAFHKTNDATFGAIHGCAADGYVADIVPIAVGVSLAVLVAIVLIAYLIGRRRSRARGYQSV